jgi:hypothetical protein
MSARLIGTAGDKSTALADVMHTSQMQSIKQMELNNISTGMTLLSNLNPNWKNDKDYVKRLQTRVIAIVTTDM